MAAPLAAGGCEIIAPQQSKALSEVRQVEALERQNQLLEEQNRQLRRIADALEGGTADSAAPR